jgi:glutathione S-transferase
MVKGRIMSAKYTLVIGDKNFSSWSLRPWIAMKHCGIPFAEERVRLRQTESKAAILRVSPSGKVPALKTNGLVVCDSLAILEFLAERYPEFQLWPGDADARAIARSISAEMHAGFVALRNEMSMDLLASFPTPQLNEELDRDIRRIVAIWREARARYGAAGPFLFGAFSSRMRMPCMHRWPPASALMALSFPPLATTARLQPMPRRSLPCRRWQSGRRERKRKSARA